MKMLSRVLGVFFWMVLGVVTQVGYKYVFTTRVNVGEVDSTFYEKAKASLKKNESIIDVYAYNRVDDKDSLIVSVDKSTHRLRFVSPGKTTVCAFIVDEDNYTETVNPDSSIYMRVNDSRQKCERYAVR